MSTLNHVQITKVQQTWPCCETQHQGADEGQRDEAGEQQQVQPQITAKYMKLRKGQHNNAQN